MHTLSVVIHCQIAKGGAIRRPDEPIRQALSLTYVYSLYVMYTNIVHYGLYCGEKKDIIIILLKFYNS